MPVPMSLMFWILDNIEDLTFFYFTELSALSPILLQVNLK